MPPTLTADFDPEDDFDYLEEDEAEVTSVYGVDGWDGATDTVTVKL